MAVETIARALIPLASDHIAIRIELAGETVRQIRLPHTILHLKPKHVFFQSDGIRTLSSADESGNKTHAPEDIETIPCSREAVDVHAGCPGFQDGDIHLVIRNLNVRTYDNPAISGIDLHYAVQCLLENVVVSTGVYNVQASKPTHGTKGIVTPANNNGALTILRNVMVTGYDTGIVVNEHTDGDHIMLGSNLHGLDFATANHASRFGRICAHSALVTSVARRHTPTITWQIPIRSSPPTAFSTMASSRSGN